MLKPANVRCCPRTETGSTTAISIPKIAVMANVPVFSSVITDNLVYFRYFARTAKNTEELWFYLENRYFH